MAIERIESEQKRESGSYKDKDNDESEPKRELLKARDYRVSSALCLLRHFGAFFCLLFLRYLVES